MLIKLLLTTRASNLCSRHRLPSHRGLSLSLNSSRCLGLRFLNSWWCIVILLSCQLWLWYLTCRLLNLVYCPDYHIWLKIIASIFNCYCYARRLYVIVVSSYSLMNCNVSRATCRRSSSSRCVYHYCLTRLLNIGTTGISSCRQISLVCSLYHLGRCWIM